MNRILLHVLVLIFSLYSVSAQKKVFDKNGELLKIVEKRNKEIGYWTYNDDYAYVYVTGKWSDSLKNGREETYYKTGKLASRGIFNNNKKNGLWETHHIDGGIESFGKYNNNLKEGEWIFNFSDYYKNHLELKANYLRDTLNGHYKKYYSNGNLEMSGDYTNGYKNGKWLFYHSNGKLSEAFTLVDRAKEGLYKSYHENGTPFLSGMYKNDLKVGEWTYHDSEKYLGFISFYTSTDKIVKVYYNNGQLKRIDNYKHNGNSLLDRPFKTDIDDFLYIRDGEQVGFREDGSLMIKFNYENDIMHGKAEFFDENGILYQKGFYKNALRVNECIIYFPNGKIKERGNYLLDEKDGAWNYYDTNGILINTIHYKFGEDINAVPIEPPKIIYRD